MSVAGPIISLFKFGHFPDSDTGVSHPSTLDWAQFSQITNKTMATNGESQSTSQGPGGSQQGGPVSVNRKQTKGPNKIGLAQATAITPNRQGPTSTGAQFIDENMFTFKPKVSAHSVKLAESLGTSFMSRQEQHLEKQRKHIEQASMQYRSISSLGSVSLSMTKHNPRKDKEKESEGGVKAQKSNSAASSMDSHGQNVSQEDGSNPLGKTQSTPTISKSRNMVSKSKSSCEVFQMTGNDDTDGLEVSLSRSRTMPATSLRNHQGSRRLSTININLERVKNAKMSAERAIKARKIFTIQGPYPAIRESLRKRGWVEKFYKLHMAPPPKKSPRVKKKKQQQQSDSGDDDDDDNDDDDDDDDNTDDDDDDVGKIPPWEEDSGIYGIMSRVVRNSNPTFIWSVRRDAVDPRYLRKDQVINHYGKATFTTKVGLCMNMRQVPWFEQANPDAFFPRCYRLSHDEEKQAFVDDYRLTACISVLKMVQSHLEKNGNAIGEGQNETSSHPRICGTPGGGSPRLSSRIAHTDRHISSVTSMGSPIPGSPTSPRRGRIKAKKKGGFVPMKVLDIAINQCEKYLQFCSHLDLDNTSPINELLETQWDEFLTWYYSMVHDDAIVQNADSRQDEVENIVQQMKEKWPQFELDGTRGVWIVKPGAKSRGRGIIPFDRLEEMLKLVSSSVVKKDSKFVVQKYIERPLLIYNVKFDIRQWFVVTDWNPLTLWFYRDSYLRFCSQEYTLEDFDESIHLANNAIQCHYGSSKARSSRLPVENMWSSDEFKNYLNDRGLGKLWEDMIYPGMKKAVICALLCTQDIVEYRKSAFELYGADFMLSEDYQPWLIEINSSPSMSYSTKVTADLCPRVLEDTIKVVVDRKFDKNADTGAFELAYKQPVVSVPPYIGINLTVEGARVKKPPWMTKEGEIPMKPLATAIPRVATIAPKQNYQHLQNQGKSVIYRHQQNARLGPQPIPIKSDQTPRASKSKTDNTVPTAASAPLVPFSEKNEVPGQDGKGWNEKDGVYTYDLKSHPLSCVKSPRVDFRSLCSKHKLDAESLSITEHVQGQSLDNKTPMQKFPEGTGIHGTSTCDGSPADEGEHLMHDQPDKNLGLDKNGIVGQAAVFRVTQSEEASSQTSGQSERKTLILKNIEGTDLQEIKTESPRGHLSGFPSDTSRGRVCPVCGNNSTYRLQLSSPGKCRCQQDGIRYKLDNWQPVQSQSFKGYYEFVPRPPSASSQHGVPLQKPVQVDRNRLLTSVFAKTRSSVKMNSDRIALKCTDATIKMPASTMRTSPTGFPKLAKYVARKNDGVTMFLDPYNAASSNLTTSASYNRA